jgi:hypothetical protein
MNCLDSNIKMNTTSIEGMTFVSKLGEGISGEVFKYKSTSTGKLAAIKVEIEPCTNGISPSSLCEIQALSMMRDCDHICQMNKFFLRVSNSTTSCWIDLECHTADLQSFI